MKYIKTFESFGVNETLDMFMMPVDPIKGAAEVWGDILDGIWEGVQKFFKGAKDLFLKSLDNLCEEFFKVVDFSKGVLEKISKYFGATAQDLTFKQVFDGLMRKNPELLKESREEEMEEYMEKSFTQKVGTILQGIFGFNAVGGIVVVFVQWLSETIFKFDLMGWANSLGMSDVLTNPGKFGFIPAWAILSLVAIAIIAIIKRADAWLSTDKGMAVKLYKPFG
jgi:hypothetical protein